MEATAQTNPQDAVQEDDHQSNVTLDAEVKRFAEELSGKYAQRLKLRPHALKRRVISLINHHLPPYPRPTGRPRSNRVTKATEMYLKQQAEIASGNREEVNWMVIALECIAGFGKIQNRYRRERELTKLRNSVHVRVKWLRC